MSPAALSTDDRVLPAGVDAHPSPPLLLGIVRVGAGPAGSWGARRRALRGVSERDLAHRKRQAGAYVLNGTGGRTLQQRQLTALHDVDAIRALGEDTLDRPPAPAVVTWKRSHRLRPVGDHVVRARDVEAAFFAWHRGEGRIGRRLSLDAGRVSRDEPAHRDGSGDAGE